MTLTESPADYVIEGEWNGINDNIFVTYPLRRCEKGVPTIYVLGRLFGGFMAAFSLDHLCAGWTTVVQPSFSRVKRASRRPGRSGVGRRGPRDRTLTREHVTLADVLAG